jgi:hypothetical protein
MLMQAGYSRVSVVRGGFPALVEAGVQVAPKDVTTMSSRTSAPAKGPLQDRPAAPVA